MSTNDLISPADPLLSRTELEMRAGAEKTREHERRQLVREAAAAKIAEEEEAKRAADLADAAARKALKSSPRSVTLAPEEVEVPAEDEPIPAGGITTTEISPVKSKNR